MHLLIIEDDQPLAEFVRSLLGTEPGVVDVALDGKEGLRLALQNDYDMLLLDLNLPLLHGLDVLIEIRKQKPHVPILVLSGSGPAEERVKALDLGADDCLGKPFACAELKARVRTLLRRHHPADPVLRVRDLELNRLTRSVTRAGRKIHLTGREFGLLELLMEHAGSAVKRNEILDRVWSTHPRAGTNVIEVYVNYLRRKVDEGFEAPLIRTVRGVGYLLR